MAGALDRTSVPERPSACSAYPACMSAAGILRQSEKPTLVDEIVDHQAKIDNLPSYVEENDAPRSGDTLEKVPVIPCRHLETTESRDGDTFSRKSPHGA